MNVPLMIVIFLLAFALGSSEFSNEPSHFCYFDSHQPLNHTSSGKTYGMVCRYGIPVDFPPSHRKCWGCEETMLNAMGLKEALLTKGDIP